MILLESKASFRTTGTPHGVPRFSNQSSDLHSRFEHQEHPSALATVIGGFTSANVY